MRTTFNIAAILSFLFFCAAVALWVRAQSFSDQFTFGSGNYDHRIDVIGDGIRWEWSTPPSNGGEEPFWTTRPTANAQFVGAGLDVDWKFLGVKKGSVSIFGTSIEDVVISFWTLILMSLPLPLFWAWNERGRRRRSAGAATSQAANSPPPPTP